MKKVVTFGELMMRLSPPEHLRFLQASQYQVSFAGSEANVAAIIASLGQPVAFISKFPKHEIGQAAINSLRALGVDTSYCLRGGERIGVIYTEKGASQRGSKVIYDRTGSAIATAEPEEYFWGKIFSDACWFHFSGITPALSDQAADTCLKACQEAKELGLTVSCDLNYRKNLWSPEQAQLRMTKLMQYVDICFGNEEDIEKVFGIKGTKTDVLHGRLDYEEYMYSAAQLSDRFQLQQVLISLRTSFSADHNRWAAMSYQGGKAFFSSEYDIQIVDRVGAGDSFAGSYIYAMLNGYSGLKALEFAVAASCLKHSIEGDYALITLQEVEELMNGNKLGRVQR